MTDIQKLLSIPQNRIASVNAVFTDPNSQVMKDFLAVVAKYGTPDEINKKHKENRKLEVLMQKVTARNPEYTKDLLWLIEQKDKGAFISVDAYRNKALGMQSKIMTFADASAVTLEVSALQYFPWIRPMCERAIHEGSLIPGRFIAVRKMKELRTMGIYLQLLPLLISWVVLLWKPSTPKEPTAPTPTWEVLPRSPATLGASVNRTNMP